MNRPEPKDKLLANATPHDAEESIGPARLNHTQIRAIYFGLMLAMFLSALNQTIVATALPSIGSHFGDVENLSWVITVYLLTATVVSPLYGKLSDIYGRRTVILGAIGIFVAGSVASAAAPNMTLLIIGRALQGLGGGGILPIVQSVIADVVLPRERGRYQAYMATVWVAAGVCGPVLGGVMADHLHWSAIFWMNLPLGLIAAFVSHRMLRLLPRHNHKHRLDFLGALLMMASAVAVLLALTWGGTRYPWFSFEVLGLFAASGLFAFTFSYRLTRMPEPFLPLSLLANPVMRFGTASNAAAFGANLSTVVFLPIYYQLIHQLSPTEAGLALIPSVIMGTPGSVISARVMMYFNHYKWLGTCGLLIAIVAMGVMTVIPDLPIKAVIAVMCVNALGIGIIFPIATVAVQNAVPREQVGLATGTVNFFRQLCSALVIAIMGAILLAGLGVSAGRTSNAAGSLANTAAAAAGGTPVDVFHWVFATAEIFLIISLLAWLLVEERPLAGPNPSVHPEEAA